MIITPGNVEAKLASEMALEELLEICRQAHAERFSAGNEGQGAGEILNDEASGLNDALEVAVVGEVFKDEFARSYQCNRH